MDKNITLTECVQRQNATFGNVVELILSIAALTKGLYTVVAASLLGSVLSNLLLVLGALMFCDVHLRVSNLLPWKHWDLPDTDVLVPDAASRLCQVHMIRTPASAVNHASLFNPA